MKRYQQLFEIVIIPSLPKITGIKKTGPNIRYTFTIPESNYNYKVSILEYNITEKDDDKVFYDLEILFEVKKRHSRDMYDIFDTEEGIMITVMKNVFGIVKKYIEEDFIKTQKEYRKNWQNYIRSIVYQPFKRDKKDEARNRIYLKLIEKYFQSKGHQIKIKIHKRKNFNKITIIPPIKIKNPYLKS